MDSILRYFALQRGDLRRTQEQLLADRRGSRAARAQAEFLRDFRLLAKNLEVCLPEPCPAPSPRLQRRHLT